MPKQTLKAVLWDLGGVLIKVDLSHSRALWIQETGLRDTDFERAFFGTGLWDRMVVGAVDVDEISDAINMFVRNADGREMAPGRVLDVWNACLQPRAPVVELVHRVSQRVDCGVLSDTDPIHAKLIQETAGVFDVVKAWTFSFEVGKRKPHPSTYKEALARLGSAAEETLFIDDRIENVKGAHAVGMDSVVFAGAEELSVQLRERGIV